MTDENKQIKKIFKNSAFMSIAQFVVAILGFIYVIGTARYLGVSDFGVLSFGLAFSSIFSIFMDLGLSTLLVRDVARNTSKWKKYLGNTISIKIIYGILFTGIAYIILNQITNSNVTIIVTIILLIHVFFNSLIRSITAVYQALEEMKYFAYSQLFQSITLLLLITIAIYESFDIYGIALTYLISGILTTTLNILLLSKYFSLPKIEFDFSFLREISYAALPFSLTIWIGTMFLNIDIIMISTYCGEYESGLYKAAITIITAYLLIPNVYGTVSFPVTSKYFTTGKNKFKVFIERSQKYLLITSFIIASISIIYAKNIVESIYGLDYYSIVFVFQLLCLYIPFKYLSNTYGWALGSINKEPLRTLGAFVTLILNVTLNFFLIPKYGVVGAAIATLISQATLYILYKILLKHTYISINICKIGIKAFICTLLMVAPLIILNLSNVFFGAIIGIPIYITSMYFLNLLDKSEISQIITLIQSILNKIILRC